jgi:hypothetical protein
MPVAIRIAFFEGVPAPAGALSSTTILGLHQLATM